MPESTNTEDYRTTDKTITLLLLIAKIPVQNSFKDDHGKTVFVFDPKLAQPWLEKYHKRELPDFAFDDMIMALGLFNSIVHSR